VPPIDATTPIKPATPDDVLAELRALLPLLARLCEALERHDKPNNHVDRLTLRLDELAASLGVSRSVIDRLRAAGRLPRPDLHIGKMSLYKPETIRRWIEDGGR
jgi:predicted DNA-binding transcriptional regulator AlpA